MIGILLRSANAVKPYCPNVLKKRKSKRGDINYVLGIIVVAILMLIIVAAVKLFTGDNLLAEITTFINDTLFNHITNPFTTIDTN